MQFRSLCSPLVLLCLGLLCLTVGLAQALPPGTRFTGRVSYRGTKQSAPGVLVEIVEAEDDGKPKDDEDDVLAATRTDAQGRFAVILTKSTGDDPVALVASAVRVSAASGGDRRREGYEVKTKRRRLGFLVHPSPTRSNTILIERRRPGRAPDED